MRRGAPSRRPIAAPSSAGRSLQGAPLEQIAIEAWVKLLMVHKSGMVVLRDSIEQEMTLARFDLLSNLARLEGQTLATLSRNMLVTAGNLTGLVDRASRDGLVERRADPTDRRAWRVHITPKGLRTFRHAERRYAARVAKVFAELTQGEMLTFAKLLDKIRASTAARPGVGALRAAPRPHPGKSRSPSRRS